jgi:hypothetical protein
VNAPLPALILVTALGGGQLLPPPRDGDIRTAYYELQHVTDVWLTLEPRTIDGKRAPTMTFTYRFPGKRQAAPPREVEVRGLVGQFWAPRGELRFELDGREVVTLSAVQNGTLGEGAVDSWSATVPMELMERLARAQRISGSSLGFRFEFSGPQRQAIRTWLERISPPR